jgi:hypothetical protein
MPMLDYQCGFFGLRRQSGATTALLVNRRHSQVNSRPQKRRRAALAAAVQICHLLLDDAPQFPSPSNFGSLPAEQKGILKD